LRSTSEVPIRALEEAHAGVRSLLHPAAREQAPDLAAFIYSLLRLPACIHQAQWVILGQSPAVFARRGFGDVESWQPVSALARRRRCFFNGRDTLACYIASRSDIDDVIPLLTAYQIEWNKFHELLKRLSDFDFRALASEPAARWELARGLLIAPEDLDRLHTLWGQAFIPTLLQMARSPRQLRVQLLSGSLNEYRRATHNWWENIERVYPSLNERPVYFISSNTHSLANLLTGFALRQRAALVRFLEHPENANLLYEWRDIQDRRVPSSQENFLYYILKKYQGSANGRASLDEQIGEERACGLLRIPSEHSFDVEAQAVELSKLRPDWLDPRLVTGDLSFLARSDALILNIDYPLGLAAYDILTEVAEQVGEVLGVYIMGKAASLNGVVGDVVIPNVVHDEHSQNSYLYSNGITAQDVSPHLVYGTVLDNQKSVSVQGTFLQTARYMDVFYREGYTDIEMEAGPYLSAVFEMFRPRRHPVNEIVNLYGLPFDLGIVHYVSDTPLSKGKNLGAGSLSYFGMDSTYAVSIAVLRRIFRQERERLARLFSSSSTSSQGAQGF
jgi:hypothetical protein